MINNLLIHTYELCLSDEVFIASNILSTIVAVIFYMKYRKNYNLTSKQMLIVILTVYALFVPLMFVLGWASTSFVLWGVRDIARVLVFVPLICLFASRIAKADAYKVIDCIAPGLALQWLIVHLTCPVMGCCHGYPCDWGIWNPTVGGKVFPIQWIECLITAIIFIIILKIAKKTNYSNNGRNYAWLLVLFGLTRFGCDFLRDNEKVVFGLSELAVWALLMMIVGLIWLIIDKRQVEQH